MLAVHAVASDVKFHQFFCPEIFHEIFQKYFKNFTMLLNNGQHQSKYTQYKQTNRHTVLVVFNRFYYNARQKSL